MELTEQEKYMYRCLELAAKGAGYVAPNPMVGAVLVHKDAIIGEGYHMKYGEAHAEVNCVASVPDALQHLIPESTLYVSLEPCAHYGKTPPCADLIIERKIKKVVIGCRDPFREVNGKGIERLLAAGVRVETGILESDCIRLNRRFFTYHQKQRPYIILKWAQSSNGKMAFLYRTERAFISGDLANRLVHRWRHEEAALLIGTNTALYDNPSLTVRYGAGVDPIRLVIDRDLKLPTHLNLFSTPPATILFNYHKHTWDGSDRSWKEGGLHYFRIMPDVSLVQQVLQALYQLKIVSVLIEGGAQLLQSFIEEGVWDEARVIVNEDLVIDKGLSAPELSHHKPVDRKQLQQDRIHYYVPVDR